MGLFHSLMIEGINKKLYYSNQIPAEGDDYIWTISECIGCRIHGIQGDIRFNKEI